MRTFISSRYDDGGYGDEAEVLYTVEGSKCKLLFGRTVCSDGNVHLVRFILNDTIICSDKQKICLLIEKMETDFLSSFNFGSKSVWKTKKNVDAWDGVTETKVFLYGTANRCGLLVWECKKNNYHERDAKAVTIAHYFVSSNGSVAVNRLSETTDIGFSVVVKVGVCDGKFDVTVEGPEAHPVSALLYMFGEVNRSGIWKPSMCPHCGNIRREHSRMFSQSDSEDSDGFSLPPPQGNRQNRVTIDNGGRFRGNANGSSIICKYFYGFN